MGYSLHSLGDEAHRALRKALLFSQQKLDKSQIRPDPKMPSRAKAAKCHRKSQNKQLTAQRVWQTSDVLIRVNALYIVLHCYLNCCLLSFIATEISLTFSEVTPDHYESLPLKPLLVLQHRLQLHHIFLYLT